MSDNHEKVKIENDDVLEENDEVIMVDEKADNDCVDDNIDAVQTDAVIEEQEQEQQPVQAETFAAEPRFDYETVCEELSAAPTP